MRSKCVLFLFIFMMLWAIILPASAAETSGVCGADVGTDPATEDVNLLWNFDVATGTLTISGKGYMSYPDVAPPWGDWRDQITQVVVEGECYNIAQCAFTDCQNLTSVTLPDTVLSINKFAFSGCKGLEEIQLPEALKEIDQQAFRDSGISQIEIPKNVTNIGAHAFMDCTSLKRITFLGPPPSFGFAVFNGVTASVYHPENPDWVAVKGQHLSSNITWVTIPCPGHQPESLPAQEATCTQIGLTAGVRCSLCFTILTPQKQLPMTAHNFGPWVETVAPPQWGNGLAKRCCTVCNFAQTKAISSTTVLNPVIPPVTEAPITPPATETPVTPPATEIPVTPPVMETPVSPPTTDASAVTDASEASTDSEKTTAPTQAQIIPTVSKPTDSQVDEPVQKDTAIRWWVVMLITGIILLGGSFTVMILFRGGITVFKKK